jgi:hypothetical protein
MALSCPAPSPSTERFEFIDCGSISINYIRTGIATLSFTVVSSDGELNSSYTDLTFGGVRYNGPITGAEISRIPKTAAYQFRFSMTAFGC